MPKTYILIDSSGKATMIPERDVERIAAERMVSGQSFQIYRAEPMKLQISLTPAAGAAPIAAPSAGTRVTRRKKAGRKKASKRRAGAKKTAARRGKGTGKVGRPPVNIGPCTVAGCSRSSKTRGLCSAHYQQHRRLVREKKPGLIAGRAAPPASKAEASPATKKAKRPASRRRVAKRGRPARKKTAKPAAQAQAKK